MNELKRNGSGYYDPTAYKAMINAEKGEDEMKIYEGEIYEVQRNDGRFMEVVIIAVHEETSNILILSDKNSDGSTRVICKGEKYTDANRICYIFNDQIRTFIRKMKDEEFAKILDDVRNSLGIKQSTMFEFEWSEKVVKLESRIDSLIRQKEDLLNKIEYLEYNAKEQAEESSGEHENEMYKLQVERDFYKEMYNKLLGKLIA